MSETKVLRDFAKSVKSDIKGCKADDETHNIGMGHRHWRELTDAITATLSALSAAEQRTTDAEAERDRVKRNSAVTMDELGEMRDRAEIAEQRAEAMGVCLAGLVRIVEEVGCKDWRDENGRRLKDTPEWVQAYNENAKRNRAGVQACRQGDRDMLATDAGKELLTKARAAIASGAGDGGNG